MPKCKNCGTRLTKFDTDICPVCGTKKPLEGVTSDTIEVTSEISMDADVAFRVCNKKSMFMFFAFLGPFGVGFCYLKKIKLFVIWLFAHLLLLGGSFSLMYFVFKLSLDLCIIIPLGVTYFYNIIIGLVHLLTPDLKDGEGEYVR